jgi:GNAT superfamily N-acetyltransferase
MTLTHRVVVRPFTELDADEVSALIRRTLLSSNIGEYSREELEGIADWYGAAGLILRMPLCLRLVAAAPDEGDRIVGTAARRENRLEGFFVSPDWQRRGVGEQLLGALEDSARHGALRVLWLDSSVTATGFYERKGYVAAGGARDDGEGLVVPMRKRL